MKLTINGKPQSFSNPVSTLAEVLQTLDRSPLGLIIEKDGKLYREEHFSNTPIQENDILEIIHFMGGG